MPPPTGTPLSGQPSRRDARLIVETVSLRSFRSYAALDLRLEPGLVFVVGPNGAGKTNLLEALHVGTQGFSPRTRTDAQLVRLGERAARISLHGSRAGRPIGIDVSVTTTTPKRATVNGAPLRAAEQLRGEVPTLVFTPDRLGIVKGGPAVRRAYFDRALGRLSPARSSLPAEYGAAVAQRNAALRRIAAGFSSRDALRPWSERLVDLGARLAAARTDAIALLAPAFADCAAELGLADASLRYDPEPPSIEALEARIDRDLDRGATGIGPHLDDVAIRSANRDLRTFGSQGQQRLAVLSLLLAEAEVISTRGPAPPLLLLDDVLSELDDARRRALAARIGARGQAVVTAASAAALPVEPAQRLDVRRHAGMDATSEVVS